MMRTENEFIGAQRLRRGRNAIMHSDEIQTRTAVSNDAIVLL